MKYKALFYLIYFSVTDGFVVANDMDNKRCYLMTHQVKRIQSPNCMIINHDARTLPNMLTSLEEVGSHFYHVFQRLKQSLLYPNVRKINSLKKKSVVVALVSVLFFLS